MMIVLLVIVIALVAWSLQLMQEAVEQREFSLMLAGTLVASSAAALMTVYFLMGNYVGHIARMSHDTSAYYSQPYQSVTRSLDQEELEDAQAYYQRTGSFSGF